VTVDILPWDRNEINFVLTGRMLYCQQQEQLWGKKGRTLKLLPIYCVLVTLGKVRAASLCPYMVCLVIWMLWEHLCDLSQLSVYYIAKLLNLVDIFSYFVIYCEN